MLNKEPTVYVPIEPEGNGVTIPSMLSIAIHCGVLAFILLSHRVPKVDISAPIETSIITPEELAAMQADVIANREALAASGNEVSLNQSADSSEAVSSVSDDAGGEVDSTTTSEPLTRSAPVIFTRSDDEPDDYQAPDRMLDPKIEEAIIKEREDFRKQLESFNQEQIDAAMQEHQSFEKSIEDEYLKNLEEVRKVRESADNAPPVEKPKRPVDVKFPASKTKPDSTGDSGNTTSISLGDGAPSTSRGGATGSNRTTSAGGGGSNIDEASLRAQVASIIYRNWTPPKNKVGQSINASIRVDGSGNVTGISINSSDTALKRSLEQAIRQSSPLTPLSGTGFTRLSIAFVVK